MDVGKLVIIALDKGETSILPSAKALATRHESKGRGKPISLILPDDVEIPGSLYEWQEFVEKVWKKEIDEIRASKTSSMGVYVSGHGTGGGLSPYAIGCVPLDSLVNLFTAVGFNGSLKKVSFVACNAERQFLAAFCTQLFWYTTLTPMVAGYRGFVTPFGSTASEEAGVVYDVGGEERKSVAAKKEVPSYNESEYQTHLGKKVVGANTTGLDGKWFKTGIHKVFVTSKADPTAEANHTIKKAAKILVQYVGNEVVDVDPAKWGKW